MISEESGPSLFVFDPAPDLTGSIVKLDQYTAGGSFGDCDIASPLPRYWQVAVKTFRFNFTVNKQVENESEGSAKAARRELGVWRRLKHDNIVPFLGVVYGFGLRDGASLVSLWMPNGTLQNFLVQHGDELTVSRQLQLLLDIVNGLLYLHSFPITHGDLNCNNVLLDANNNACLADFGYASLVGEIPEALAYLQMSTMRPGTLRWAAPEHFPKNPEEEEIPQQTTKSDIYSFGNIALQASCLSTTFESALSLLQVFSGKQPWSEVQREVAVVVLLAWGKKPSRPQSRPMDDQYWQFIEPLSNLPPT
ncbi:hypothetical protein PAXINDRAFT_101001 [Paxillus involutus ATCC 200175]|uniref:Protein kinase domain-containing protein n=1 Tax=Paxillus involutus ATCC 200175 TaxID=664439 RepID=A0A0C9SUU0_PAXIN|nr:hypothetical protein PAXINDRAFT_101001 [Paxillus involutus ATCC 200175]